MQDQKLTDTQRCLCSMDCQATASEPGARIKCAGPLLGKDLLHARIITYGYDADVATLLKQGSHTSIFGLAQSIFT